MATAIEYGGHFGLPGIPAGSVVHVTLKGSKPIGPVTLLGYQPGAGVSLTEDGGRVVLANAAADFRAQAEPDADVGAPDAIGDVAEKLTERIVLAISEALRPDPDKLMARAVAAMKAGKPKKARRLMARAERILGG